MKPDDLWIGDEVVLIKSGKPGIYNGQSEQGKALVTVGSNTIKTTYDNLKRSGEKRTPKTIPFHDTPHKISNYSKPGDVIDLHINVLLPSLANELPERILDKQLELCRSFIKKSIEQHLIQITIIHGIGTGHLKTEINHLLQDFPEVKITDLINNGGATLVTFR